MVIIGTGEAEKSLARTMAKSGWRTLVVSVSEGGSSFHDACRPFARKVSVPSTFNFW
jgi:pyruvate/2-oxoglutarate dehydrogenase complex dihydrolipoamide dehydrogenase (E3) component